MAGFGSVDLTAVLARYVGDFRFADLPEHIRARGSSFLLNWIGCALGGSRSTAVLVALEALQALGSKDGNARVAGHSARLDGLDAAFINSMSAGVSTFSDTHLDTICHPSGPVLAALLVLAQRETTRGTDLLQALLLGIEISCRVARIQGSGSAARLEFSSTGLACTVGAAAACANLLRLDQAKTVAALGIAATQAAGLREANGSMSGHIAAAQAARGGLFAAILAWRGFTCTPRMLEGPRGFHAAFGVENGLDECVADLGTRFELDETVFKPYPCGIALHAAIDACLDLAASQSIDQDAVASIEVSVSPVALSLASKRDPRDEFEAQVSLSHWTAAALARGRAGLEEATEACVYDPAIRALASRVIPRSDPQYSSDAALARVIFADGSSRESRVTHAKGSKARPMTEDELDRKFVAQALPILGDAAVSSLRAACRDVARTTDVAALISLLSVEQIK